jgi:YfiH family protein
MPLVIPVQSKLLGVLPNLEHGFTSKEVAPEERAALEARVATARQVHGDAILWVERFEKDKQEADAVATFTPGLRVGVHSADCVPTLIAAVDSATNKVYGAAAVHGGWRSTALGIAGKALRELAREAARRHPAQAVRFVAAIGPCIGYESFEVHDDVLAAFPGILERGLARRVRDEDGRRKFLVDLPGETLRQLRLAAAETSSALDVDTLGLCTVKLPDRFPSYRRRDREPMRGILSFLGFSS